MRQHLNRHLSSYRFAVSGVVKALRTQSNIRIHLAATALVLLAAWWFKITRTELILVLLCIGLVIMAELLNTAIEVTLDYLAKEHHVAVEVAKDVAAGSVLIASVIAAIVGLMIFLPYIFV